jgi:nucleoside phosphorylase
MRQRTGEGVARLLDELRALALPAEKFAVFGSGPMGVRGLRDMHDVDVIVAPPVIQVFTTEQFLPVLTDAVIRGQPSTLYVSAGECDVTAMWLRRRYDAQPPPRIQRVVVLRMRDETIADLERRQHLARGFGDRLRENLAALHDVLTRRGVAFAVRVVDRIPAFHGYLYGDHLFRGSWTADDRGHLHHRGDVLYFQQHSSPERFAEAMAVFEDAPEVSSAPQPRPGLAKRQVTVGVLTPLREEWEELVRVFPVVTTERANGGFYYVLDSGSERVRLVGTYVDEMGPVPMSQRAGRLIDHFKPHLVALTGIAGSLDKDVYLGDVVAATEVNHFAASSKTRDHGEDYKLEYSGKHFSLEFVLAEFHRHFSQAGPTYAQWQDNAWRARTALGLAEDSALARVLPRDHAGHVASGDTVGTAKGYALELRGIDRRFLALEMEAAGIAAAAAERPNPVWWIAVRGISDFSDARKDEFDGTGKGAWRRYAMHNAASYLRALLAWNDFMAHLEMRPGS